MSEECLFCRIASGELPSELVFEDEKIIVFKDIYPKADIHLLVVPRQHIASLEDLNESHDMLMAHMFRLLPRLAQEQGLENGFRTIINTGPGGGQEIYHLHIHLLGGDGLPGFV